MKRFITHNPEIKQRAANYVLGLNGVFDVIVKDHEDKRSLEQNDKLHALLTDISRQKQWAGQYHSVDVWKRLMVAAFLRAENEHPLILPSLDFSGVDVIFEKTSKMSIKKMIALIEYVQWWGVDNGVKFSVKN